MKTSAFVLLIFCSTALAEVVGPPASTNVPTEPVESWMKTLTLEQKIGQLLLVGVNGYEVGRINRSRLEALHPGGVIFFGRNVRTAQQVVRFTRGLQKLATKLSLPPLFIAVDQEGGTVTRLKSWPPLPSAAAVGRADDVNLAWKLAFFTGQTLRTLGFNVNLAPVLDLSDPYASSFIGTRSYGVHPETVSRFGSSVISGYSTADILTVAKHFPGHGAAIGDSHKMTPVVNKSLASLKSTHLSPFVELSARGNLPAVMAAHLSFPIIDKTSLPATFSHTLLTDILRQDLGFSGLVFTDDIEMLGAKRFLTPEARAVAAIQAGADVIMIAWNPSSQSRAHKGLLDAVKSGALSISRIDQSVRKILQAKYRFHMENMPAMPTLSELEKYVSHRELYAAIDQVVSKNFRLSASQNSLEILKNETLVFSDNASFSKALNSQTSKENFRSLPLSRLVTAKDIADSVSRFSKHFSIIFCASKPSTLKILRSLPSSIKHRAALVTTEAPYLVDDASDYKTVYFSYTRHPDLGQLFISSLFDRSPAEAKPLRHNTR